MEPEVAKQFIDAVKEVGFVSRVSIVLMLVVIITTCTMLVKIVLDKKH